MKSAIEADRSSGEVLKYSPVDMYANNSRGVIAWIYGYEYV